jgi:hypothetical protein
MEKQKTDGDALSRQAEEVTNAGQSQKQFGETRKPLYERLMDSLEQDLTACLLYEGIRKKEGTGALIRKCREILDDMETLQKSYGNVTLIM